MGVLSEAEKQWLEGATKPIADLVRRLAGRVEELEGVLTKAAKWCHSGHGCYPAKQCGLCRPILSALTREVCVQCGADTSTFDGHPDDHPCDTSAASTPAREGVPDFCKKLSDETLNATLAPRAPSREPEMGEQTKTTKLVEELLAIVSQMSHEQQIAMASLGVLNPAWLKTRCEEALRATRQPGGDDNG